MDRVTFKNISRVVNVSSMHNLKGLYVTFKLEFIPSSNLNMETHSQHHNQRYADRVHEWSDYFFFNLLDMQLYAQGTKTYERVT